MRHACFWNHGGLTGRWRGDAPEATGWLRFFACLALVLLLPACSSVGKAGIITGAPYEWRAVQELRRGTELQVSLDCARSRGDDACATFTPPDGGSMIRVIPGVHVEADDRYLLFRPTWDEGELMRVDRRIVHSIDARKADVNFTATIVGLGLGVGLCALAKLYTREGIVTSGKVLYTGICGGTGAGIGYAIDRSRSNSTPRRIYQRTAQSPAAAR